MPKSQHEPFFKRLFSAHLELPEWGKLKMTDSGRFSMPYAMLAIMVTLFGIVIAAVVSVGLAVAGAAIWVIISVTEVKTTVASMAQEQQTQRQSIDAWKAYVNKETVAVAVMEEKLPAKVRDEVKQYRRDNPNPKPTN